MMVNFTYQDLAGSLLAFVLFPLVLVFPGYLVGWTINLFDFRRRLAVVRFLMSLVLSNAVSPIFLYLAFRLTSARIAIVGLLLIWLAWVIILFNNRPTKEDRSPLVEQGEVKRLQIIAIFTGAIWVAFAILWLVDIQLKDRLYFNVVAYDYTTRSAVVDAITRTGVPPVNPSYYPGQPQKLTYLYFFWYILASVVDQLGGNWVDARTALIASVAWCGLGLIATIAVYLRLRSKTGGAKIWRSSLLASQLLLVSGMDFVVVIIFLIVSRITLGVAIFDGRMEGWNMPIMTWLGALMWVPLHVSSVMACLTGMLLFLTCLERAIKHQLAAALVAGLSFASALGLSVWVTLTFAVFWVAWMAILWLQKKYRITVLFMSLAGVFGLIFVSPFLNDLLQNMPSPGDSGLPVALFIRPFTILSMYAGLYSPILEGIVSFVTLPLNYFFELGFFLFAGVLWIKFRLKTGLRQYPFFVAESTLVATVFFLLTFLRSTIIHINDLGIRAWLLGQFVLLIWAVDWLETQFSKRTPLTLILIFITPSITAKATNPLRILVTLGILTSLLDMFILRTWAPLTDIQVIGFPNELSPDTQLGQRTYAARLAFNYIRDHLPKDIIVQDNSLTVLDRPSGLYGTRQMVISEHAAYGVPNDQYESLKDQISGIFLNTDLQTWKPVDRICLDRSIDVLIVKDTDPFWHNLAYLSTQRSPLFQNKYYALFACGGYASVP